MEPESPDRRERASQGVARRLIQAAGDEADDRHDLLTVQAVEPFQKVVDIGSCLDILKDSGDRHTCTFENPGSAYFAGDAFYGGAL